MTEKQLVNKMTAMCVAFSVVLTSAMGVYVAYREVPVNAQELSGGNLFTEADLSQQLTADVDEMSSDSLFIPLPAGYNPEDVQIDMHILEKTLDIHVKNMDMDFLYSNPLTGSNEHIDKISYGYNSGHTLVAVEVDGYCECESFLDDKGVHLTFEYLEDKYDYVVLIDPGHGGDDTGTVSNGAFESEIDLAVACEVANKLKERGIGVILTREADTLLDGAQRNSIAEALDADMMLSIHCSGDPKTRTTEGISSIYNGRFMGEDGRACALINENVSRITGANDLGYKMEMGISLLDDASVMTIMFNAGYLTNKSEALKLLDESYVENMALGIALGIEEFFYE